MAQGISFRVVSRPNLDKLAREINVRAKRLRADLQQFFKSDLGPAVAKLVGISMRSRGVLVRSGKLSRSIVGTGSAGRNQAALLTISVGGPKEVRQYGAVHEVGTQGANPKSPFPDITARDAKYLTVPNPSHFGGESSVSARNFGDGLKAIIFRQPGGTKKNVAGKLVFEQAFIEEREEAVAHNRRMDFSSLQPIYFLLNFVRVEPKFFMRRGVEEAMSQILEAILGRIQSLDILRQSELISAASVRAERRLPGPAD